MKKHMMYIIPALALGAAACTSTGETERNALGGAAIGAAAGAIIGNNTGDGDAATGAAVENSEVEVDKSPQRLKKILLFGRKNTRP